MRRFLVFVLTLALGMIALPPSVQACSCAQFGPIQGLDTHDAAFVGTYLGPQGTDPNGNVNYLFEVEKWVKGDLGAQVGVISAADSSACGLEVAPGQRMGIFVTLENGVPHSGLCSTISPDVLLAALEPVVLDGSGPLRYLIGGGFGPMRLLALDSNGGLLGYNGEDANLDDFSVCPGGRTVTEIGGGNIIVRDLTTMEEIGRVPLQIDPNTESAGRVWCRNEDASDVMVSTNKFIGDKWFMALQRYRDHDVEQIIEGEYIDIALGKTAAVVTTGPIGERVVAIDLASGGETILTSFRIVDGEALSYGSVWINPGGDKIAVEVFDRVESSSAPGHTVIYDLAGGQVASLGPYRDQGITGWLSDTHVGFSTWVEPSELLVYEVPGFELVSRQPFTGAWSTAVVGDDLIGLSDGKLSLQRLAGGEVMTLKTLPGTGYAKVVVIDNGPEITATTQPTISVPYTAVAPTTVPVAKGSGPGARILAVVGGGLLLLLIGMVVWRRRRTEV